MANATEIRRGAILDLDGAPWLVTDVSVQTPSARGASLLVKARVRNLASGQVLVRTFRGGDAVEIADCEKRAVQFLYRQDDEFVFMDSSSFEQVSLPVEVVGDAAGYLVDGLDLRSLVYNGRVLSVELPVTVDLEVVDTPPVVRGATATAQLKPATLSTGVVVQVPPYISPGERVRVDTRDGHFVERVKG